MTAQKKRIAVIGCTGSVGTSILDLCRHYPDRLKVEILAANSGGSLLPMLCREFKPRDVVLMTPRNDILGVKVSVGDQALMDAFLDPAIDHVAVASSGIAAAKHLWAALKVGKEVSLANKESALLLGQRITSFCRSGQLRPLDSEHNALWQCIHGENWKDLSGLFLTASGGPFLRIPLEQFEHISPELAMAHPVWSMGRKLNVDSATMINKAIEILEAHYLFGLASEKIHPLIHPSSIVHGMAAFVDSTVKMLASSPDMRLAALTAILWPERAELRLPGLVPLDPSTMDLHFEKPEKARFPGLFHGMEAAKRGGSYPVILIAADQRAVDLFLERKISFPQIAEIIGEVMESYSDSDVEDIEGRMSLYQRGMDVASEFAEGRKVRNWKC